MKRQLKCLLKIWLQSEPYVNIANARDLYILCIWEMLFRFSQICVEF